jgi:hypothetical protein
MLDLFACSTGNRHADGMEHIAPQSFVKFDYLEYQVYD